MLWKCLHRVNQMIKLQPESSGLRVNYYLVKVSNPQREDQPPYQAECEDIIQALGMTFDEGSAFKALWRTAAARTHGLQKANNDAVYNYEKVVHYGGRLVKFAQIAKVIEAHSAGHPEKVYASQERNT